MQSQVPSMQEVYGATDPVSLLRLYSAQLAEATLDPVWLADQLCSEGIIDMQIQRDLSTTSGMSVDEKSLQLWRRIATAIKFHPDPKQVLLNVCYIMKQRTELRHLAASLISQLKPDSDGGLIAHYLQLLAEKDQQLQAAADQIALLESRLTVQQVSTSSDHYKKGSHALNAVRPWSVNTGIQAHLAVAPAAAHKEIATNTGGQIRGVGESDQQTLNATPTLLELKTMEKTDGTPLNIIEKVAAGDYTTFGMFLLQDVNGDAVEMIKKDHRQDGTESITQAIIRQWLTSGGPTCTYEHLIESLNKSRLGALAELIADNR